MKKILVPLDASEHSKRALNQAKELAEYLASQSISIRDFSSAPGLTNCLRITIGTADENDKVLQAVAAFFEVNP